MKNSLLLVLLALNLLILRAETAFSQVQVQREVYPIDNSTATLADLEIALKLMALIPPADSGQRGAGDDDATVTVNGDTTTVKFTKDGKTYIIRHNSRTGKTTIKIKKNRFVTYTYTIECDADNNCTLKDYFGNTVCTFERGGTGDESGALGSCDYLGSEFEFVVYIDFEENQVCVATELGTAECIDLTDLFEGEDLDKVIEMLRKMFPKTDDEPAVLEEGLIESQMLR